MQKLSLLACDELLLLSTATALTPSYTAHAIQAAVSKRRNALARLPRTCGLLVCSCLARPPADGIPWATSGAANCDTWVGPGRGFCRLVWVCILSRLCKWSTMCCPPATLFVGLETLMVFACIAVKGLHPSRDAWNQTLCGDPRANCIGVLVPSNTPVSNLLFCLMSSNIL